MLLNISYQEFETKKDNFIIIDIRSIEKYNNSHIPNSINIPSEKLILEPEKYLDKYKTYCLYCTRGITSNKLGKILSMKGYKILNLDGGYESWILNH